MSIRFFLLGSLLGFAFLSAQSFTITVGLLAPVTSGSIATSTITVTPSGGFTGIVNLTVRACPGGSTCTLTPPSVTSSGLAATAQLSIATTAATPQSSGVTVTGTSGSLTSSGSTTLNLQSASDLLKSDFGFGVALGLSANVTGPNIVNNASIDADGIVRVNTRANTSAGFMLETHYFIFPRPTADAIENGNDKRWWGTGPFVAAQPGTSQILQAVGAGWMIGFRRPKGSKPSAFSLGIGYEAIPSAQVLGSEFVENKPAPLGPTGQPLPIRYETQDKGALLFVLSVAF